MACGIYKIVNQTNQKIYIGQSVDIERRWKCHRVLAFSKTKKSKTKNETPFCRALRKYGIKSFSLEIVEECPQYQLNEREIFWINEFQATDEKNGYNLSPGGLQTRTSAKLSEKNVLEIRQLLKYSILDSIVIAKQFNVAPSTIRSINNGSNWKDPTITYPLRKRVYLKKKTYSCIDCGSLISNQAIRCVNCYRISRRKIERPNREKLKKLIKEKSFTNISKQYGVTISAIKKWCKSYNLPSLKKNIKLFSEKEWETI